MCELVLEVKKKLARVRRVGRTSPVIGNDVPGPGGKRRQIQGSASGLVLECRGHSGQ